MDIKNRQIFRFRAHYDPSVGNKPRQAFDKKDMPGAVFEMSQVGIYVKLPKTGPGSKGFHEYIVPFANVVSIMLEPLEEKEAA